MKRKNYRIFLSAVCLGALLTACGDGAAPTESSAAEMTEETAGAVTETAAESETTTETTSESLETTTVETTAAETTTAETTTAETTTAAPETTVTEAETTETEPHEYPNVMLLSLTDDYTEYIDDLCWVTTEFDIDDPEILYLTVNAHYLRVLCLFGGTFNTSDEYEYDQSEAWDLSYFLQTSSGEYLSRVWPTYVNYQSFIDCTESVFTDEYINKLENPDISSYNNTAVPKISEQNGMLFRSSEERGINPSHKRTIYRIHEHSDDKLTIERETVFHDMNHNDDDPDYYEPHSYCYIDLVKTPDGWRYDYFPMFDEYNNDIYENGEWFYPEYHE